MRLLRLHTYASAFRLIQAIKALAAQLTRAERQLLAKEINKILIEQEAP